MVKGQRKAFGRQRITESSCTRKKTVDIYILSTASNGERTIMQSIKISSGPATRMGVVGPVQQVHTNIYQRKDLNWLHVNDEPRVPERQQVKDQWSYISASGVYLIAARSNSPDMTTVLHARLYGRFIEIYSNFRRKKLQKRIKAPILYEAVLPIEIL